MTWNSIMGIVSSVALFLPILFILVFRLSTYRTFPALLIYYIAVFAYNLLDLGYIKANTELVRSCGLIINLLDVPLMLTFLTYFSTTPAFTRKIRLFILAFILFEATVVLLLGFNVKAITITMGPGIIITIIFCISFFVRQTKITITHRKATGKALIAASLLFAYGCYGIIYLMYYVFKTTYVADTFLIYFLVVTLSSLLISAGIILEQKRIRKLLELKTTRRELSNIYANDPKNIPQNRVMLDFDRDLWN